jgi:hypothetical protein
LRFRHLARKGGDRREGHPTLSSQSACLVLQATCEAEWMRTPPHERTQEKMREKQGEKVHVLAL